MSDSFTGQLVRPRPFYRQWMLAGNPARFFDQLAKECGDFVHYRGLFSFYMVNHPALVKQVLMGTHKAFDKNSAIYDRFRNAFGDGLVVAEGSRWKRQRTMMQPMFGPTTVEGFFDTMVTASDSMICRWGAKYDDGQVFNIAHEMERITLEIAGRTLFSEGFDDAFDQITCWTDTINRYSSKPPLPVIRQFWFPSNTNRRLKQTLNEFHEFIRRLISQRREGHDANDLLSILIRARSEDGQHSMDDSEIIEEVLGMIIGGHETSSSALTWLWYELHHHPEVQDQLMMEIQSVAGDGALELGHVPQLKFARMVIDEVLRLHPPFWFENRSVREEIDLGGHRIPKGSTIVFSRYSLHRNPEYWQFPDEFVPLRQDPDALENPRSSYAQVPFGGGPRICIGIHFAMMELVVILARTLQHFQVVIDSSDRHQMAAQLTMAPKHGLRVRLKRKNRRDHGRQI